MLFYSCSGGGGSVVMSNGCYVGWGVICMMEGELLAGEDGKVGKGGLGICY